MATIATFLCRRIIQYQPSRQIHITKRIVHERYFTRKHEWIQLIGIDKKQNGVRIGISDYAQCALGDVVYCELPSIGTRFKYDDAFATLESVKAVSDCYMPVDGEIVNVNENLQNEPDLINKSPYENGWLVQAIIDEKTEKDMSATLMNEQQYNEFLEAIRDADNH